MGLTSAWLGRGARRALLCFAAAATLAGVARATVPPRLADGSPVSAVPAPLRRLGGDLVTTRLRLTTIGRLGRLARRCDPIDRLPAGRLVVDRVGVAGRSLTFENAPGSIHGCDMASGSSGTPFCGISGRSRAPSGDTGLTVCQDRRGRPVAAFAWIETVRATAWVVVGQPGFREACAVAGRLPVRVETASVPERGAVRFRVSQYDRHGRLLVGREVNAVVAG
jgi:hypothetical protein